MINTMPRECGGLTLSSRARMASSESAPSEHTLSIPDPNYKRTPPPLSVVVGPTDDNVWRIQRAQWLRAAILGANDGLLSTASLMLGVSSAKEKDQRSMVVSGIAGTVAGAFSMAVGEFVSVSAQRDMGSELVKKGEEEEEVLPHPGKAAIASGSSFMLGSLIPLLSSAFVERYQARLLVLAVATSVALAGFGGLGAYLGGSTRVRVSATRVLCGGWLAMGLTFWLLKLLDKD